jgi:hypothetical protein
LAFYFLLLQQALLRWPNRLGEVKLYRGVDLSDDDIDTYRERVGQGVTWGGFASTSRVPRIAERMGNTLFVIHTRDRPYIGDIAAFPGEREVLFAQGTCNFMIEGVMTDPRTGRVVIELRDFQCFPDYDTPLTQEETREWMDGREGGLSGLVGPVGQEGVAESPEDRGALIARLIRLGAEAWRKCRAQREADLCAAKREGVRRARVDARLMLRAAHTLHPGSWND